ncbi:MAG: 1-acyl-sn-glycerol-3-phosphate acyltransferase [Bacteroidia bacterium]|nr:1-acyl-sn-glycerol-3-phosphate acyltransferase [Bacteroidia bacterium]
MPVIYGILAVYGTLLFALTLILAVPTYFFVFTFFPPQRAPRAAHQVSRFWAGVLMFFLMVRVRVKNREILDPNAVYVVIANHLSQLDIPTYAIACTPVVRFLAKAELGKIPLLGYVIRRTYLMVKREDKADRHKIMIAMQKTLEEGIGLFLCPEGTRNRTEQALLPFKDGAFRLAIRAQVPLAVLVVYNSHLRNRPAQPLSLVPGTIEAEWLEVVDTRGMTEEDVEKLRDRVWSGMKTKILNRRSAHGK